jgi:hypothetical protein
MRKGFVFGPSRVAGLSRLSVGIVKSWGPDCQVMGGGVRAHPARQRRQAWSTRGADTRRVIEPERICKAPVGLGERSSLYGLLIEKLLVNIITFGPSWCYIACQK